MTASPKLILPARTAAARANGRYESHAAVGRAVRNGDLPRQSFYVCVDCGVQAKDYEHRDYSKPLAVEPVCHSCNGARGRGRDHPETSRRLENYVIERETNWRDFVGTPSVVPMEMIKRCDSYSAVVRLAWDLRISPHMTSTTLCERIGVRQNHISDMLAGDGKPGRRELPAKKIPDFELAVGNRAVTQYQLLTSEIAKDLPLLFALIRDLETSSD